MTRGKFIGILGTTGLLAALRVRQERRPFPPWRPGLLDIHHIATGRGSSTLLILPDGTTMMVDAGATQDGLQVSAPPKPSSSRRPGQWIARYAARQMQAAGRTEIDYFLLSHFHPDHAGDVGPDTPLAAASSYRLTGVMDVDALLPIRTLIDRGYPDYGYPSRPTAPFALNYLQYIEARRKQGRLTERFQAGSSKQIRLLRQPQEYPSFSVRNIAANGEVWTGTGDATRRCFPSLDSLPQEKYPSENMCSAAIRLRYGKFGYFTGGDLTSSTNDGESPWRDIETPVAEATGPVDVAVANHHGYYDALGPSFMRSLRPKVFIIPTWHISHPDTMQLERMLNRSLYPGLRDIYATNLTEVSKLLNARLLPAMKSVEGHIVVRVRPGGDDFTVMVLENNDESDTVRLSVGPYPCA
jgi:hypothetical protein